MTNPNLSLRAEQAIVGALLQDPSLREEIAYLRPDRFTHPTYRALFTELNQGTATRGDLPAEQLPERVATRLSLPGVDAPYLRSLSANCPEPTDIAVYARMVQEAYVRSQLASHVDRIAASAGPVRGVDPKLDQLDRLAQALARQSGSTQVEVRTEAIPQVYEASTVEVAYETPVGDRAQREELVLADLLQHGGQVTEVEVWLSADNFAPGPRREIYEAILAVAEQGEPVNELTVAWELSRRANSETVVYAEEVAVYQEPMAAAGPAYLAHLVSTAVVVGIAVEVGNELFVEDLRTDLAVDASRIVAEAKQLEQSDAPVVSSQVHNADAQPIRQQQMEVAPAPPTTQPPPVQPLPDSQPKIRP